MKNKLTPAQRRALNWLAIQRDDPTTPNAMSGEAGWFTAWGNAEEYHQHVIPASEATMRVLIEEGYVESKRLTEYAEPSYHLIGEWTVAPDYKTGFLARRQQETDRNDNYRQTDSEYRALWQRPDSLEFAVGTFVYVYINRTQFMTEQLGLVVALESQDERGRNRYAVQTSQGVYTYPAHQLVAVDEKKAYVNRSVAFDFLADLREQVARSTFFWEHDPVAWYDNDTGDLVVCDLPPAALPFFTLWLLIGRTFAVDVKEVRK